MNILNNYIKRKIVVFSISLFLILLFYLVPTKNNIEKNIESVYLLDKYNYVSKVIFYFDSDSIENEIKRKISILISGEKGFKSTIPKGTIINNIKIQKNNAYIDFNDKLLEVKKDMEEVMIESIVYTISDINGLDNIYISINSKPLKELPNSKKILDYPLTRKIGINKKYDITSFNNINMITVLYSRDNYYVPVSKISNDNNEKIEVIIKELKSRVNEINNLNGLNNDIELLDYTINDKMIKLVFNNIDNNEYIKEILSYSIFENYSVNKIIIENESKTLSYDIKR